MRRTDYEWLVEFETPDGEIMDHECYPATAAGLRAARNDAADAPGGLTGVVCLRQVERDDDHVGDYGYAYPDDNRRLPADFSQTGRRVPARFRQMFEAA